MRLEGLSYHHEGSLRGTAQPVTIRQSLQDCRRGNGQRPFQAGEGLVSTTGQLLECAFISKQLYDRACQVFSIVHHQRATMGTESPVGVREIVCVRSG